MMLSCLALSIVMAYSSNMVFLLNNLGLSRRDRDVRASDIGEHMCFFSNLRQSWVYMNLSANSWDCAFVEKVKLEELFVDLFLQHIVLRQPTPTMMKYKHSRMYDHIAPQVVARHTRIVAMAWEHGALVDAEWSEGSRHRRHPIF